MCVLLSRFLNNLIKTNETLLTFWRVMCAFLAFSASKWQEKAAGSLFFKLGVLIKKKKTWMAC